MVLDLLELGCQAVPRPQVELTGEANPHGLAVDLTLDPQPIRGQRVHRVRAICERRHRDG